MHTTKSTRCLLGSLLLAALPALADTEPPAPPVVEVAPVQLAAIAPQVRAAGAVISTLDADVAAEVPGRLVAVADVGRRVRKGEQLATINDQQWQLQRQSDETTVRRLEANLAWIDRQQQRLASLASSNNMAQSELDELLARREMGAQEVESAKIQMARTEYDIARARVVAPFDGVVAERFRVPGEYTKAGDSIVRVVNTTSLEVSARAPIAVTRYNREGTRVQVTGDFGAATLPIRGLVPVSDAQSKLVEVRLDAHGLDWVIGEPVEVLLTNGARAESIAVPRAALVQRKSGAYVFRVDEGRIARKVSVVPSEGDDGEVVTVKGELRLDDKVVVLGGELLRDGQTVAIRTPGVAAR
jgi:RND family efflux transporter MFP subunit